MPKSSHRAVHGSLALAAAAALLLTACAGPGRTTHTQIEYQPDMYVQPYVQGLGTDHVDPNLAAMRMPPEGTVPVHYTPFPQPVDVTGMDKLANPLPVTPEVLAKGQQLFDNYCIVCHGARADGLGYIIPKMTQPPALIAGAPLLFSDGRIFSIITSGQGNMPSYQTELDPAQRWAIIHYVRVLQRAANPTAADLARAERSGVSPDTDYPTAEGPSGPIPGTQAIPKPTTPH
ncbi:MAG TPA: cytochrome c [Terriglobales bacterium]|nr:cytochrome c [Terriglobales bacterium]